MGLTIPGVDGSTYYSQRVRLSGRDYLLTLSYRTRIERWKLDVHTDEGDAVALGVPIDCNWPLLRSYRGRAHCPAGDLIAVTTQTSTLPPGLTELGENKRVELTYYEPGELDGA
jgi:hypothetical protein